MVVALGTLTHAEERAQGLAAEAAERIEGAGIEVRRDVVYADLPGVDRERQTLDLYLPSDADRPKARRPIVLYVHGGGWIAGSKAQAFLQPLALVPEGFIYASANYRLRPDATVAEMAQSVASAAAWLTHHAHEFGGDPHTIFLVGHSVGAHLVSLLGTNGTFLQEAGVHPASVRGVVSLDTAVYDLPKLLGETETALHHRVFGEEQSTEAVSPWHHVEYGAPHPVFLIFYSEGRPAAATQTIPFADRLNDAGHEATVVEAVGRDHRQLNNMLGTDGDRPTAQIVDFLRLSLIHI